MVCGSEFGFYSDCGDPLHAQNLCIEESCCAHMEVCLGDGSESASALCLSCLEDSSSADCDDPAVTEAARAFHACKEENCDGFCVYED